tara:strand:- start:762 stop:875 length:114 start_codon:yes stop_codon:yes gene_type:complete
MDDNFDKIEEKMTLEHADRKEEIEKRKNNNIKLTKST